MTMQNWQKTSGTDTVRRSRRTRFKDIQERLSKPLKIKRMNQTRELLTTYLKETSIHGFRYVVESQNLCYKLLWLAILVVSFSCSATMIAKGLQESYDEPILTTIETTDVKNVPFPAITIKGSDFVNPWGFIEKSLNMLAFMCLDDKDPTPCQDSKELRANFSFLFHSISDKFNADIFDMAQNYTLQMIKDYPKPDQGNLGQILPSNLDDTALKLAAIMIKNESAARAGFEEIMNAFEGAFPKIPKIPYKMTLFAKESMKPIVNKQFDQVQPVAAYESCKAENQSCYNYLKNAYLQLYLPFMMNKIPYLFLGFGSYLSYFSRLVTKSNIGEFMSGSKLATGEKYIQEFLSDLLNGFSGADFQGLSLYELVNLIHKPCDWNEFSPALYQQKKFHCMQREMRAYYYQWMVTSEMEEARATKPCLNFTDLETIKGCCNLSSLVYDKLEIIMKIMKYAQQPPHLFDSTEEIESTFGNGSFLKHNHLLYNKKAQKYWSMNSNPIVLMGQYAGVPRDMTPSYIDLLRRSYTNDGIGYTFNQANFWNNHKDTEFNKMFADVMNPRGRDKKTTPYLNADDISIYPDGILFPENSGTEFGLTLVVQGLRILDPNPEKQDVKPYTPIKVAIHDPLSIGNVRSTGIIVEPGTITTFLITPSQIVTAPSAMDLEEKRRGCRFLSEDKNLKIFRGYNQGSCLFECQVNLAFERCQCIPWDYPHPGGKIEAVCDLWGKVCFENVIGNSTLSRSCDCPFDCTTTRYSYSYSSTTLDAKRFCNDDNNGLVAALSNDHAWPPKFIRRFEQITRGYDISEEVICEKNMKGIAIVKFQLASNVVNRIKKTFRVSYADQLSSIGGTMGLFTGMSIISCFEALFWLFKSFQR